MRIPALFLPSCLLSHTPPHSPVPIDPYRIHLRILFFSILFDSPLLLRPCPAFVFFLLRHCGWLVFATLELLRSTRSMVPPSDHRHWKAWESAGVAAAATQIVYLTLTYQPLKVYVGQSMYLLVLIPPSNSNSRQSFLTLFYLPLPLPHQCCRRRIALIWMVSQPTSTACGPLQRCKYRDPSPFRLAGASAWVHPPIHPSLGSHPPTPPLWVQWLLRRDPLAGWCPLASGSWHTIQCSIGCS
ncbi:hypothetical protein HDV57DRAFT_487712, partial [Trichoderma longibrachiatum]